ncbi:glycosyltransferase [Flavobacterium silvisoli]|uniref:Glycosyltransferase n=1 Tax=Flavobacterium silvisoli TaxID=2529433 RepID=A0A4V2L547_9FLAO|nr:glycosyltransferase [Flavobacterium silvisoli]TBX69240.1 glycosyltransferase [Flavobacterium silvisoli]
MRIVQIIDSLEVGGAEKMAVNYANAIVGLVDFSGLITTRTEGALKAQLSEKVTYLFLKKTKTIDFGAAWRLRNYCKTNRIEIVHAHSSSYFVAVLTKFCYPKIKIVWHDHNGLSEFISKKETIALKLASFFFKGIIVVNDQLKKWAQKELNCSNVIYFPNFTSVETNILNQTSLKGTPGKRILCLANLRLQKNHFLLLEVAQKVKENYPEWTFHLVGKDFNDEYSAQIKALIVSKELEDTVFVYGSKNDTTNIILQSDIAILTSDSEGLPVALIEYGLLSKAVVTTNVGEIPFMITHGVNGFMVNRKQADEFYLHLVKLIEDETLRNNLGKALYKSISENNSEKAVIAKYLNWLKK